MTTVTLYRHSNFRGKLGTLGPGVYNVQKFKIIDNNFQTSLKRYLSDIKEEKNEEPQRFTT